MSMSSRVAHQRHSAAYNKHEGCSSQKTAFPCMEWCLGGLEGGSPCEIKPFVQEEQPLNAVTPLVGSRSEAQAAPCHVAYLVPNMLALHIWTNSNRQH